MRSNNRPVIRKVTVTPVCVEMPTPHRTASGVVSESPLVLVDLLADDGTTGHGIVFTYTRIALKPVAELVSNLGEMLIGRELAPASLNLELASRFRLLGTQGLVGMALAGLDMATWDAFARSSGISLLQALGGSPKPVKVYGGIGYDGPLESAKVAEHWARLGFSGVKAKIGYETVEQDLAVIKAIRSAVGDGMAVMVDYNQSLLPCEAIERIRLLDELGLTWVEEPVRAHDYRGHAQVRAAVRTPIQCGENWWGIEDLSHAIDATASTYVMPDVMKIGGISGWLRASALAESHGLPVSSHLWPEVSAQLLAATPTAHWLEYADWWNPILENPLSVDQGVVVHQGEPGTGIQWSKTAVARCAV